MPANSRWDLIRGLKGYLTLLVMVWHARPRSTTSLPPCSNGKSRGC